MIVTRNSSTFAISGTVISVFVDTQHGNTKHYDYLPYLNRCTNYIVNFQCFQRKNKIPVLER